MRTTTVRTTSKEPPRERRATLTAPAHRQRRSEERLGLREEHLELAGGSRPRMTAAEHVVGARDADVARVRRGGGEGAAFVGGDRRVRLAVDDEERRREA